MKSVSEARRTAAISHVAWLLLPAQALLTSRAAGQNQQGLDLSWEAPSDCPQLADVRQRIDSIAGASVERASGLQAQARIVKEQGRFHLKLVVRDGASMGERSIASDSCTDLAGAAAVALGLLLRSETRLTEGALSGSDPTDATQATPATTPSATAPAGSGTAAPAQSGTAAAGDEPDEPDPADPPSMRSWRAIVRIPSVAADWGPLPEPSLGLAAGLGIGFDEWRGLLIGRIWRNESLTGTSLPSHGADLRRQTVTLAVGRGFRRGNLEASPFLAVALERLSARGAGEGVEPSDQQALWLGVGAGVEGRLHLTKAIAAVAEVGVRVETSRPIITIDGLGRIRQLGPMAASSALGIEWSF